MRIIRRTIVIILSMFLFVECHSFVVHAFDKEGHNKYMEKVLFGRTGFTDKTDIKKENALIALEYASYLAVDQFNAAAHPNDAVMLEFLKNRNIPGLPKTIDEIDYTASGKTHRRYTHRGWNYNYGSEKWDLAHWETRRSLLLNTAHKELSFGMLSKKLWFDYSDKCKSFAAFLYYVHIIGDHMGTDYANVALDLQMIPLANRNEANIIDELEDTFAVLFDDQTTSVYYKHLLDSMKDIKKRAIKVFHSTGGLNTEEKYLEYQKCAEDLMDLLIEDIPPLLKNEEFFSKVFYSTQ